MLNENNFVLFHLLFIWLMQQQPHYGRQNFKVFKHNLKSYIESKRAVKSGLGINFAAL